jgi:hypothetical protein
MEATGSLSQVKVNVKLTILPERVVLTNLWVSRKLSMQHACMRLSIMISLLSTQHALISAPSQRMSLLLATFSVSLKPLQWLLRSNSRNHGMTPLKNAQKSTFQLLKKLPKKTKSLLNKKSNLKFKRLAMKTSYFYKILDLT